MAILLTILKYLIPLIITFLVILFVIKPLIELLKKPVEAKRMAKEITISEEAPYKYPTTVSAEKDMKEQINEMVKNNPKKVVSVLREWMTE